MKRPSISSERSLLRQHNIVIESMCNRKKDLLHYHDFVQLWYVFNGTLRHTVGDKEYLQTPGSCVIVLPFTEHAIDTNDSDDTPVTLSLSFMDEFLTNRGIDFFSYSKKHSHFEGFLISEFSELRESSKTVADELAHGLLSELTISGKINFGRVASLLSDFLKLMCPVPAKKKDLSLLTEHTNAVNRAIRYIADHSAEKIMREDLCSITAMSRTAFSKAFKEVTGTTTKELLLGIRIRKAQFLLQYTDKTLNEIASEVGLYDKSYLTHLFSEHFGMTPMRFREQTRPAALESDKQTRRRMKFYPKILQETQEAND